jgi:hypothetical protein
LKNLLSHSNNWLCDHLGGKEHARINCDAVVLIRIEQSRGGMTDSISDHTDQYSIYISIHKGRSEAQVPGWTWNPGELSLRRRVSKIPNVEPINSLQTKFPFHIHRAKASYVSVEERLGWRQSAAWCNLGVVSGSEWVLEPWVLGALGPWDE